MVLLGQQLLAQRVQRDELARQQARLREALGDQHDLGDELKVGHDHGAAPEQRLQVLWQLGAARVTRVHGDEDANGWIQADLFAHENEPLLLVADGVLDSLDLEGVI